MLRSRVLHAAAPAVNVPYYNRVREVPAFLATSTSEASLLRYKGRYIDRLNRARRAIRKLRTSDPKRVTARETVRLWYNSLAIIDKRLDEVRGVERFPRLQRPFAAVYTHRNPLVEEMIVRPAVSRPEDDAYAVLLAAEASLEAVRAAGADDVAESEAVQKAMARLDALIAEPKSA
jgi:hypothetical protein